MFFVRLQDASFKLPYALIKISEVNYAVKMFLSKNVIDSIKSHYCKIVSFLDIGLIKSLCRTGNNMSDRRLRSAKFPVFLFLFRSLLFLRYNNDSFSYKTRNYIPTSSLLIHSYSVILAAAVLF